MTDERFEEFLRRALDELEPVPAAPREEMWARIDEARRFARHAERRAARTRTWINWGVGLAAMLAVGIGIGRMSARPDATPAVARTEIADARPNPLTYQVAVTQHLNRAELLLASFRTQPEQTASDAQLAEFARDLLSTTRLLLDSPAAEDPKVAVLLADLELILTQMARLTDSSEEERELIRDGLDRTAVLPRLRATTSASAVAGT